MSFWLSINLINCRLAGSIEQIQAGEELGEMLPACYSVLQLETEEDCLMSDLLVIQLSMREIEERAEEFIEMIAPLSEEELWFSDEVVINSIGTLTRHMTGNFNHFFGAGFLKNGYVRDREAEFSGKNMPKAQIISDFQAAVTVARQAAAAIYEADVNQPYRTPCERDFDSLGYHVLRLVTHFAHHHGQVSYAVRYVTQG